MERSVTTSEFPSGVEQSRNFIVGHVYIAYNYGGRRRRREFQIRRNGISFYLAVTLALSLPLSLSLSLCLSFCRPRHSNFRVESPYRSRRRSKDNRLTDLATTKSESRPLEIQGSALRRARIKFRLIRAALLLRTAASGASKNEEFDSCGFRARRKLILSGLRRGWPEGWGGGGGGGGCRLE